MRFQALTAAQRPIAAVTVPAGTAAGSTAVLDASGSAAACGRSVAAYSWVATGGVTIQSGAAEAQATVLPTAAGSLTRTVTDSAGAVDTAALAVSAAGVISKAASTPSTAGSATRACPASLTIAPKPPTAAESFSPASVAENVVLTLTITIQNGNAFALTQSGFTHTLPANLSIASSSGSTAVASTTTCGGAAVALTSTGNAITLTGADIPADGSCSVVIPVQSRVAGSYADTLPAKALSTGPAGANTQAASATLTVTAPSGGGGAFGWWEVLCIGWVLIAGWRRAPA